jgi:hypothetical protein
VPLENSKVNIALSKKENTLIRTVPTDTSGRFSLPGIDLTGDAMLIASAIGMKEQMKGWLLLDSLHYSPAKVEDRIPQTKLLLDHNQLVNDKLGINDNQLTKENLNVLVKEAKIKKTIRKKYKLSDTVMIDEVKIIEKRPQSARDRSKHYLHGEPDKELIISPLLQAISNDNLRQLIYGGGYLHGMDLHSPPLIMINGGIVSLDALDWFPVNLIERVDITSGADAAVWGERARGGVISIITRSDGGPATPVYHSVNMKISGYNEARIFYSPKHSSTLESDYKLDLRTTLFWEPNIQVKNKEEFSLNYFNADNSSIIKIAVEGITTTGIPVTAKVEYEVK